jgi:peptidoglycan/LPS O-acetylase OafA/YrhL
MTPTYRSDIDGLRAIAVLVVVIFHTGIQTFSGGYVGVDIFFVISGYLITTIIVREIEKGEFSIAKFYERRCRRILPALVVVVIFSLVLGFVLFHPSHLIKLGKSAIATALFSSNFYFYHESGYFETASKLKPLLHTWSLAVEEQYYIFFPLLLLFIAKSYSKQYARWLIILTLLSLVICVLGTSYSPSATFYLIPTRTWELLLGSLLAINVFPLIKNQRICDLLSVFGLILISCSIFFYTSDTAFPGMAAIVPTVGAGLIIYSGIATESLVGKLLSFKPLVFIGLISYSLYLWHWPILAYAKYYSIQEISNANLSILLCVIFMVSVFSWRYIERPFRKKEFLTDRRNIFITSLVASVLIVCIGVLVVLKDGFPNRYQEKLPYEITMIDKQWEHWGDCERIAKKVSHHHKLCDIGSNDPQARFILWGDSHTKSLATAVDLSAKHHGITGKIAIKGGCLPLLSIDRFRFDRSDEKECYQFNQNILQYIKDNPDIKTVILAARWAMYTNGTRYKNEHGETVNLNDVKATKTTIAKTNIELVELGLKRTVSQLRELGKTLIFVRPIPEIGFDVPSSSYIAEISGRDVNSIIAPSLAEYQKRIRNIDLIATLLESEGLISTVDPAKYLCSHDFCKIMHGNDLLYRDDDHLSTYGAEYISGIFDDVFVRMVR